MRYLRSENIYPIFESSDGTVWLGTLGGGLTRIRVGEVRTFGPESGVPDVVWALEEDYDRSLWIGGTGLCRFRSGVCNREGIPSELATATVRAIHQREDGSTWFGTMGGLYRLEPAPGPDRGDGEWQHFTPEDGIPVQPVRVFLEGTAGALWMGTNGGGIVRLEDGAFTTFTTADGLCSDLVRALYLDDHGALWIGTEDRGLCRINLPDGDLSEATVIQIDQRHGLYDHGVHRILDDGTGRLWMSGNQGIWWITREDLDAFVAGIRTRIHSTAYTERAGLPTREANGGVHPAGIRASDGRLWFPTQAGAVVFDPSKLPRNDLRPPVHIEEVAIGLGEERRVIAGTAITDPFVLTPGERQMEVVYTAPSFNDPSGVRFRYRLEGFDEDWVEADTRRLATYTNLRPDTYRFHVIAANEDGVWNQAGAALELTVRPYWYETRMFLIACAVLLLLTGLVIGQRRRRLERRRRELETQVKERTGELVETLATVAKQAEALEELDKAKSRFFTNISHEFRTPLSLILGFIDQLKQERSSASRRFAAPPAQAERRDEEEKARPLDVMERNANRLLRLVNQLLDLTALDTGAMSLKVSHTRIDTLLKGLLFSFSSLADQKKVTLHFKMVSSLRVEGYVDREKLEKIIINLLSNAIRYTPENGTVNLKLEKTEAERE